MEKRLFVAVAISFAFYLVWMKIFPPAVPEVKTSVQVVENREDIDLAPSASAVEKTVVRVSPEPPVALQGPEETVIIENEALAATISSRGGRVVSLVFKLDNGRLDVATGAVSGLRDLDYDIVVSDGKKAVLTAHDNGIVVRRTVQLTDEYGLSLVTEFSNVSREAREVDVARDYIDIDAARLDPAEAKGRDRNLHEYSIFNDSKVLRKTGAVEFRVKDQAEEVGLVEWFGFRNRYFCLIAQPKEVLNGYRIEVKSKERAVLAGAREAVSLEPGASVTREDMLYAGPQKANILSKYGKNFEKIHVYFKNGFLDMIAKIIEDSMIFTHRVIHSWGAAIIIVSLIIYALMYPFTFKSLVSMKKMQSLQPKIMEIREKYPDNPKKLNEETMRLYAENRINPFSGCLPIFLQMPVFIGLYQVLWRSVWFNGSGFLWIKDLSQADRLVVFDRSFLIIGNELNILPILMMILMFFQQKLSSRNMVSTDPNQVAQQKMMLMFFPLFLGFIFYKLASGLNLYFTMFYLLSIVSQLLVARHTRDEA